MTNTRLLKLIPGPARPSQITQPNNSAERWLSRDTELRDLPHLALRLLADLVRHPPPEADGLDLLVLVAGVVHDDGLLHALELAGEKAPPRLWLQFEGVSLGVCVSILDGSGRTEVMEVMEMGE